MTVSAVKGIGGSPCRDGDKYGVTELHESPATWFRCPEGSADIESGHVVLEWANGGVTYRVGFHGHDWFNRRLAMTVAQHLRFVAPGPDSG